MILVTLVIQGSTLPWIIRWLRIEADDGEREKKLDLRLRLAGAVLDHIGSGYAGEAAIESVSRLRARYEQPVDPQLQLELIGLQRAELARMRRLKPSS